MLFCTRLHKSTSTSRWAFFSLFQTIYHFISAIGLIQLIHISFNYSKISSILTFTDIAYVFICSAAFVAVKQPNHDAYATCDEIPK